MLGLRGDFLQELGWLFLGRWDKRRWIGHMRTNRQGNIRLSTMTTSYWLQYTGKKKKKDVKHVKTVVIIEQFQCDNLNKQSAVPLATACFESWIARLNNDVIHKYNCYHQNQSSVGKSVFARHITAQVSWQITGRDMIASSATALGLLLSKSRTAMYNAPCA